MIEVTNECVDCGLHCIGSICKYFSVPRYYCDICGDESVLYDYDGSEICADCLIEQFEIIKGSDIYC